MLQGHHDLCGQWVLVSLSGCEGKIERLFLLGPHRRWDCQRRTPPKRRKKRSPPQKRGGVVREEDERVNHGAVCEGHILVVLWKFGIDPISPCCWRGGRRVLVREEEQRPQRQDSSTCRVQSALRRKKKGRTGGLVWKGHRGP